MKIQFFCFFFNHMLQREILIFDLQKPKVLSVDVDVRRDMHLTKMCVLRIVSVCMKFGKWKRKCHFTGNYSSGKSTMIATTTANAERVPVHEWEILNVSILSRLYIQIPYNTGIGTEHYKYGKLMRFETVMDGRTAERNHRKLTSKFPIATVNWMRNVVGSLTNTEKQFNIFWWVFLCVCVCVWAFNSWIGRAKRKLENVRIASVSPTFDDISTGDVGVLRRQKRILNVGQMPV